MGMIVAVFDDADFEFRVNFVIGPPPKKEVRIHLTFHQFGDMGTVIGVFENLTHIVKFERYQISASFSFVGGPITKSLNLENTKFPPPLVFWACPKFKHKFFKPRNQISGYCIEI